jgi:hypothetical protein
MLAISIGHHRSNINTIKTKISGATRTCPLCPCNTERLANSIWTLNSPPCSTTSCTWKEQKKNKKTWGWVRRYTAPGPIYNLFSNVRATNAWVTDLGKQRHLCDKHGVGQKRQHQCNDHHAQVPNSMVPDPWRYQPKQRGFGRAVAGVARPVPTAPRACIRVFHRIRVGYRCHALLFHGPLRAGIIGEGSGGVHVDQRRGETQQNAWWDPLHKDIKGTRAWWGKVEKGGKRVKKDGKGWKRVEKVKSRER